LQTASSSAHRQPPPPQPPKFPTAADDLGLPSKIAHFPDAFPVWLRDPMSADDLDHLESLCGGKLRVENRKSRFDPENIQRLVLRQPSRKAIELLARRNDVHFNGSELARDLIYETEEERDAAYQFVIAHALRKDRRGQHVKVCLGEDGMTTLYSGPRKADSVSVAYPTRSKVTKDRFALHQEERTKGPSLKRKVGSLRELLNFDHVRFWQDNSHYYRVSDVEGLGRAYLNYHAGLLDPKAKARRKPHIIRIGNTTYNVDARMGHQLIRVLGLFSDDQITLRKPKVKASSASKEKSRYPGYWSIHAARSIQNLYDRLNHIVPLDRFMSRIDALGPNRRQSANSEISPYMRHPEIPAKEKGHAMSNRYGYDPLDESERHISQYSRRKRNLESQQEAARLGAAQAKAKQIIDIAKLKRTLASKPNEQPERKGGPLPSDFHWAHHPDEE
jgi:hypothetical protein